MTLSQIRAVIPEKYMRPDTGRALFSIALGVIFYAAALAFGVYIYSRNLWFLFPVFWILAGSAVTSLFILGHDCGHYSLLRSRAWMVWLGHFFLLPAFYPFFAWKHSHDAHHKHTNLLSRNETIYFDNASIPYTPDEYRELKRKDPITALAYRVARIFPPAGAWMHLLFYHFQPGLYKEEHRKNVYLSYAFMVAAALLLIAVSLRLTGGLWPLVFFWFLPALVFQAWMAVYTFLHHTSEQTPFFSKVDWNPVLGQVRSTINCLFPRWISFLHFNIDIHLPHHAAATIPGYWLRHAGRAIKNSEYGYLVKEVKFSWGYLIEQMEKCRLFDERTKKYVTFRPSAPQSVSDGV